MKICIDAGHGGVFNNATAYDGVKEKAENLTNALALQKEMEARRHTVLMTRITDTELDTDLGDDLDARANMANDANVDCFLSAHENGYADPAANGIEVIYGTNASQTSIQWANDCLDRLVAASGLRRRRTFAQSITVLKKTKMPCILVEFGFMTNKNDMDTIRAKRAAMITAIADSCEAIFGKVDKPVSDPYAYELADDAPLYRYVGEGKKGTGVTLDAYPISDEKPIIDGDENGVIAQIKDENGNIYLVPWIYLKKK